ncbi:flavoprotein [Solibacillus sp. FSL W7-1472]|uniref:flavoprotein n=1 Tax=Solibacillus sp. FSL W7-1472 TaxID=2921707 RepID=UPI0030DAF03B
MDNSFSIFLDTYLDAWRNSSLVDLKELISQSYEAREITGGDIVDFGYVESLNGWEQGFNFAKENNAQWNIRVVSILPLRKDETMAILSATMVIQGESLKTANLFFQTFKKYNQGDWKLVRSYIEAGISLNDVFFNNQVL